MSGAVDELDAIYRAECTRRGSAPSKAMLLAIARLRADQTLERVKTLEARVDASVDMLRGRAPLPQLSAPAGAPAQSDATPPASTQAPAGAEVVPQERA